MNTPKVLLGIPSRDTWLAEFGMNLTMLAVTSAASGVNLAIKNIRGTILPNLRHDLAQAALDMEADYLFMIDSDMNFPADSLLRLLSHGRSVVAAGSVTRSVPAHQTAFLAPNEPLDVRKTWRKCERVWRVGCGMILIRTSVFRGIEAPWFPMTWQGDGYQGEDWGFMDRLEEASIERWVDPELSKQLRHIGNYVYGLRDVKNA